MSTFLKVKSNLNHDGVTYKVGQVFEAEPTQFQALVNEGVLEVLAAETYEAAVKESAALDQKAKEAAETPEQTEQNTWGPKPDPTDAEVEEAAKAEAEGTTETKDEEKAPELTLAKFKVLKDFEIKNQSSKNFGKHVAGEILEADPVAAEKLVELGTLELVTPENGDNL